MLDVNSVRDDFPALKNQDLIYLDNAATSMTPEPVTRELINYYHELGTSVYRGIYKRAEETTNKFEYTRRKTADFIGAESSREIVFTKNCTESLNILAYSLHHWKDRNGKILVTEMDHHSNILPWRIMAESSNRFQLEYVRVNREGQLDMEDLEAKLSSNSVALAFPAISNVIGAYNPVKKLTDLAHENGALAVVDGAQWLPHRQFNVRDYNVDFLAFSAHKMLGPTGLGILYGKEELLEQMPPPFGGGEMVRSNTKTEVTWNEVPQKFEAGTPPIAQIIAFSKTLSYLNKLGMSSIRKHVNKLTAKALRELEKIPGLKIFGPGKGEERGGLVSFNLEGVHPHDLAAALDSLDDIAIRAGLHCAQPLHEAMKLNATSRASFYVYNDEAEIDRLVDAIKEAKNVLGGEK
ncbi:SufS family cysteine desulfurase [Candidatus Bipolaricaulota bacterium]|nr:SufS family cysteine desulfurase [Candidatus Bipolaricaulota bacterium]